MTTEVAKRIYRELAAINRKSVFDDEATVTADEENPRRLNVQLTPMSGPLAGGCFTFIITLPENYPVSTPNVKAVGNIYHPNISHGGVCFSMFSDAYSSAYGIEQYVNGLLWLLKNPNHDSRLNNSTSADPNIYVEKAQLSLLGGMIDGVSYPPQEVHFTPDRLLQLVLRIPNDPDRSIRVSKNAKAKLTALKSTTVPVDSLNLVSLTSLQETVPFCKMLLDQKVAFEVITSPNCRDMRVTRVASTLNLPTSMVTKMMLLRVSTPEGPRPVVFSTTDNDHLDVEKLQELVPGLDAMVKFTEEDLTKMNFGYNFRLAAMTPASLLSTKPKFYVDKNMFKETSVVFGTERTRVFVQIEPQRFVDVLNAVGFEVTVMELPRRPAPPPPVHPKKVKVPKAPAQTTTDGQNAAEPSSQPTAQNHDQNAAEPSTQPTVQNDGQEPSTEVATGEVDWSADSSAEINWEDYWNAAGVEWELATDNVVGDIPEPTAALNLSTVASVAAEPAEPAAVTVEAASTSEPGSTPSALPESPAPVMPVIADFSSTEDSNQNVVSVPSPEPSEASSSSEEESPSPPAEADPQESTANGLVTPLNFANNLRLYVPSVFSFFSST